MGVERRRRLVPALSPLLVALALTVAACDGGIFGTGDGSDAVIAPSDSSSPPTSSTGGGALDGGDGDLVEGDTGEPGSSPDGDTGGTGGTGEDGGGSGDGGGDGESVPTSAFSNMLDVGMGSAPRARLVDASAQPVTLADADGTPFFGSDVLPGESGALVTLPPTIDELRLRRTDEDGEETLLYRLVPVTLSMSSVTTLIVRDAGATGEPNRGVDVVALETRLTPSDPAQALVRIVQGVQGGMANGPGEEETMTRYRLVPAGTSPGGVEVTFEGISFGDDPATRYRDVPAGDYRLESSGPSDGGAALSPRPVSIEPGDVRTFVIVGTESVIDVTDGMSSGR